ncbi:MAG: hypothetical protein AAGF12_26840 [Myxococcota bacterium]
MAVAFGLVALGGCAALSSDMKQAETAYEAARYDDAVTWLRDLEDDTPDMSESMRARFFFLRGMTAFRLGERDEALYYLAVTREVAGDAGGSDPLGPGWRQVLDRTLTELVPDSATFRARAEADNAR